MDVTSEGAELSRDVLSSLAHELGGIASALDLRAAAMARTVPEQDLAALKDIVEEVRQATKAARFARGADGLGMLDPSRKQSLDDWWKLAVRFTSSVLPRGISIETSFATAELTARQVSAMTWIWLAACKELAERGIPTPCSLQLRGANDSGHITLVATIESGRVTPARNGTSRWLNYASRVAADIAADPPEWTEEAALIRWRFGVPAEAT